LGSGLGLVGVAAAKAGAHVIFTDYEEDALLFAGYNAKNNLPPSVTETRIEFHVLDWRHDTPIERVDVIIGADIVYERRNFQPILDFVRRSLKNDGAAIFTDPDRETGMEFFAMAEQQSFDVSVLPCTLERSPKPLTILLAELKPGLRQ
ncbi:MAG: methyltransferase domain-containing protein, partial [Bacteroidota bacterium]